MPSFKWLVSSAEWVFGSTGASVPTVRVKGAAEAIIAQSQADMGVLAQKLVSGEITRAVFEQEMRRAIDRNEIGNAALAHGGPENLTPRILERSAGRIAKQYEYLNQFVRQDNVGLLSPAQLSARAVSYSNDGRATYENEYNEAKKSAGFGQACRILGNDDNCEDCLSAASDGWVSIDDSPDIGDSVCGSRCRCVKVFRLDEDAESVPAVNRSIDMANTKLDALQQLKAQKENLKDG